MAVNESISAYSTTAANNTPAGSNTIGPDLDNHLRDIKKNIRLAVESSQGPSAPADGFVGRWYADTSGSASDILALNIHDGGGFVHLFDLETSANEIVSANLAASAIETSQINLGGIGDSAIPASGIDFSDLSGSAIDRAAINIADSGIARAKIDIADSAIARAKIDINASGIARTNLDLSLGTGVDDMITLISGSATTIAALPVVSGEFLTNLDNIGAFVRFDASSGTPSAQTSLNITSITDNGAGDYTFNFTKSFASATSYGWALGGSTQTNDVRFAWQSTPDSPTAGAFRAAWAASDQSLADGTFHSAMFFGDQ